MNLGQELKQLLRSKGYHLNFVAEKTGIPYSTLRSYTCGVRDIPKSKLKLICLVFDLDEKIFGLSVKNK